MIGRVTAVVRVFCKSGVLTLGIVSSWRVVGYDQEVIVVCDPFEEVNQELWELSRVLGWFGSGGRSLLKGSSSARHADVGDIGP